MRKMVNVKENALVLTAVALGGKASLLIRGKLTRHNAIRSNFLVDQNWSKETGNGQATHRKEVVAIIFTFIFCYYKMLLFPFVICLYEPVYSNLIP